MKNTPLSEILPFGEYEPASLDWVEAYREAYLALPATPRETVSDTGDDFATRWLKRQCPQLWD